VRLASTAPAGAVSGNLTIASTGVSTQGIALFGTVGSTPGLSPREAWRALHFPSSANTGDGADLATPDGDGLSNLVKYALCLTPGSYSLPPAPQIVGNRLHLDFQRDPARTDITIQVQATSDILNGPWTVIASSTGGAEFTGAGLVNETANGPLKDVSVGDTVDITTADPARRFLRIRVIPMDN
jgi:hypothetical protein